MVVRGAALASRSSCRHPGVQIQSSYTIEKLQAAKMIRTKEPNATAQAVESFDAAFVANNLFAASDTGGISRATALCLIVPTFRDAAFNA
jgi:hypothetical protein